MIVAVTGGRGMFGHALRERLPDAVGWSEDECDVTSMTDVERRLDEVRPEVVVHAAAYTDVDGAESDRETAHAVNAEGSANVARACRSRGVRLIAISTDYVFPGTGTRPLDEEDAVGPASVYGATKLEGERAVLEADVTALVVRTCGLYGPGGRHFPGAIAKKISAGEPLTVVQDQVVSPTYTRDLAAVVARLIERPEAAGVLHAANVGAVSWYEFAKMIAEEMGEKDHPIRPVGSESLSRPAPRPAYSALDSTKIRTECGIAIPTVRDALARFVAADLKEMV